MMFLQYAIWGAWLPLMYLFVSVHRGFSPVQIGNLFMVGGVGGAARPVHRRADRGSVFQRGKIPRRQPSDRRRADLAACDLDDVLDFLVFALVYSVVYAPTLALTNSLAFHHLPDRDRDFGRVRVWGTVGWIAVGIAIGQYLLHFHTPASATPDQQLAMQAAGIANAFKLSAVLGLAMGIYCFTLPKTPPAKHKRSNAVFEAMSEMKRQPLLTLFLLAIPISCIHQFYFIHTGPFLGAYQTKLASDINKIFGVGGGGLMTIGQMSEVIVLALMPIVAKTLSRKTLLAIGICGYAVRMALFAYVEPISASTGIPPIAILMPGVAMHGLCFGCFIFVAFMVVDENGPRRARECAKPVQPGDRRHRHHCRQRDRRLCRQMGDRGGQGSITRSSFQCRSGLRSRVWSSCW